MAIDLVGINPGNLPGYWPKISEQVKAFADLSGGRLTDRDIVTAVLRSDMQLWAATDGEHASAMLTQIAVYPTGHKDAKIFSATGHDADRWLELWPKFEAWARAQGCATVIADHCRPGWKKLLAPLGFAETHLVLEKRL